MAFLNCQLSPASLPEEPHSGTSSHARVLFAAVVLVVLTLAAYWPALHNQLVNWDDDQYILSNPHLRAPDGWRRIWLTFEAPQYYPLTFSVYRLQYQLWGTNPLGYHAVNLALHTLNALLVLALLRRLGLPLAAAWMGACLFALHPVQVASVAWTAEMKNVLSGVFYLTALLLFVRYRRCNSRPALLGSVVMFLGALLSKTAVLTFPASLFLLDWLVLRQPIRRIILPLLPFLLLAAAAAATTVLEEGHGDVPPLPTTLRPLIAAAAIWFYLGKLIWPWQLLAIYPRWEVLLSWWPGWLALVGILLSAIALLRWRRRIPPLSMWSAGHFLLCLLPILGFVPFGYQEKSFVADHFVYLASIGFFLVAGLALRELLRRLWDLPGGEAVVVAALALLLGTLGTKTRFQTQVWATSEQLWRHTLAGNPLCAVAENNLGIVYMERGARQDAFLHYQRALDIDPGYPEALTNLGTLFAMQRSFSEAERYLRLALDRRPDYAQARNNLGNVLASMNRVDEAIDQYRRIIDRTPAYLDAHLNLARALQDRGDWPQAADALRRGLTHLPGSAVLQTALAGLLASCPLDSVRNGTEAMSLATSACRTTGYADPVALDVLAMAAAETGDFAEAVRAARLAEDLARQKQQLALAADVGKRIQRYTSQQPYRAGAASGRNR